MRVDDDRCPGLDAPPALPMGRRFGLFQDDRVRTAGQAAKHESMINILDLEAEN
jgi:hypothetical protein